MPVEMVDGAADVGNTPRTFTVPGNAPYSLTSVKATYDGSAAGTDFYAALGVYTQDGKLVARFGVEETVTAGDTALKTFSPFSSSASGGAIRFNRTNQGGYLRINTPAGAPATSGGFVVDASGSGGFYFEATGGFDTFWAVADFFFFDANNGIYRFQNSSLFDVTADGVQIAATADGVAIDGGPGDTVIYGGDLEVQLPVGGKLTVVDSTLAPIFRVDENGDLHGLTGKSLTFDL